MRKIRKKYLRILNNEKGSLLIFAYLVLIIFLGLGAALLTVTTNEARIAERDRIQKIAFNIAEAGIERGLYDLREDFLNGGTTPSWADGDINGYAIGPNTGSFYSIPYSSMSLNGGTYTVELKNDVSNDNIWVRATGTFQDATHTLQVYVRMIDISPWNNAIFAGAGASGQMVNGNVNIRGSVHVLGENLSSTDLAIDLGGTAELVGNNYNGLDNALKAKVPVLPTTVVDGETVETLNAELRVKHGQVGLSGSSSVGEANVAGNSAKELVDGSYVTDGWSGTQGASGVHSDNGTTNAYDLGDAVGFPSLSDPYPGYSSYQDYLYNNSLVLTTELSSITPNSSFSYSNANGSISMDGSGNLTITGIVYVDGNNSLNMSKVGANKTITYSGKGAILVEGSAQIDVNLVTSGNSSFPNNIIGIMTPNNIGFNEASIDVMGIFYAENQIRVEKQTDIMGTIVSNYFDMGTNVPAIFQVPETINNLPAGMIGSNAKWYMVVVWQKV